MSNERINLTQTEKEAAEAFRKGWHADPHRVPRVPLINYQRELIEELIAELKKTYKEIDDLRTGLDMAHRCLAAHNFRQCHECGDHYHDDYGPLCGHTASE
jgi:hypothetical protein